RASLMPRARAADIEGVSAEPTGGAPAPAVHRAPDAALHALLAYAVERGASDLHLKVPSRPIVRVNGALEQVPGHPPLAPADTERFADELLRGNEAKRRELEQEGETDLSHARDGLG